MRSPAAAECLYVLETRVEEHVEAEWNRWHSAVHMPQVVQAGEFRGASKYRVVGGDAVSGPTYFTLYEATSAAALETYLAGPDVDNLRRTVRVHFGSAVVHARVVLVREGAE